MVSLFAFKLGSSPVRRWSPDNGHAAARDGSPPGDGARSPAHTLPQGFTEALGYQEKEFVSHQKLLPSQRSPLNLEGFPVLTNRTHK